MIFFEAFHHCIDHKDALTRIRDLLKPKGFICFSGEPILSNQLPDRAEILPYPWGLAFAAPASGAPMPTSRDLTEGAIRSNAIP